MDSPSMRSHEIVLPLGQRSAEAQMSGIESFGRNLAQGVYKAIDISQQQRHQQMLETQVAAENEVRMAQAQEITSRLGALQAVGQQRILKAEVERNEAGARLAQAEADQRIEQIRKSQFETGPEGQSQALLEKIVPHLTDAKTLLSLGFKPSMRGGMEELTDAERATLQKQVDDENATRGSHADPMRIRVDAARTLTTLLEKKGNPITGEGLNDDEKKMLKAAQEFLGNAMAGAAPAGPESPVAPDSSTGTQSAPSGTTAPAKPKFPQATPEEREAILKVIPLDPQNPRIAPLLRDGAAAANVLRAVTNSVLWLEREKGLSREVASGVIAHNMSTSAKTMAQMLVLSGADPKGISLYLQAHFGLNEAGAQTTVDQAWSSMAEQFGLEKPK